MCTSGTIVHFRHMKSNPLPIHINCTGQMLTDLFTCTRIYGCNLTALYVLNYQVFKYAFIKIFIILSML